MTAIGDTATLTRKFHELDVLRFVNLTRDDNPIHMGPDAIVHGMLTASMISTLIGTKLPGPGSIWIRANLSFLSPARVGDTLTAVAVVRSVAGFFATFDVSIANQDTAVLKGDCLVRLPGG